MFLVQSLQNCLSRHKLTTSFEGDRKDATPPQWHALMDFMEQPGNHVLITSVGEGPNGKIDLMTKWNAASVYAWKGLRTRSKTKYHSVTGHNLGTGGGPDAATLKLLLNPVQLRIQIANPPPPLVLLAQPGLQQPPAGLQPPPQPEQVAGLLPPGHPQPVAGIQPPAHHQPVAGLQPPAHPQPIAGLQPPAHPQPVAVLQAPAHPQPVAGHQPPAHPQPAAGLQPPDHPQPAAGFSQVIQQLELLNESVLTLIDIVRSRNPYSTDQPAPIEVDGVIDLSKMR
ncbi:hypothetical protein FOCC_FOCC008193 [Frankliniella occidentalis]|nr:hypothetical protein FOCC_FOCC008193 [Frankliniella occidentalis]